MSRPVGHAPDLTSGSAESAYRRIRDLIVAGRLSPGSRLVETALADSLGVSRGAIRPALLRLRQEGHAIAPGSGRQARLVVAPLTRDDAVDLYSIVGELDGLAASLAAVADDTNHGPMMVSLQALQVQLERLSGHAEPDPITFLELDREFHRAYVAAAGRPRLFSLYETLRPQLERYALLYAVHVVGQLTDAVREHGDIITAFATKDPLASRDAVRRNWSRGAERLVAIVDRVGARGDWYGGTEVDAP
jgi:DNA-binding GntR family transcriptional regulator